jgi:hypothetical protein
MRLVEVPMSPESWIEEQPEGVREDLRTLDARIRAAAPGLACGVAGEMLTYGPFRYRYASGREGDTALVSVAVRKAGLSIYVNAVDGEDYVAEAAAGNLGKAKVGRSCITFKRVSDLKLEALDAVIRRAVAVGGAGQIPTPRP